jgi:hypothetical protein
MFESRVVVSPGSEKRGPGFGALPGVDDKKDIGVGGGLEQLGAVKPDLPAEEHGPVPVGSVALAEFVGLVRADPKLPDANEQAFLQSMPGRVRISEDSGYGQPLSKMTCQLPSGSRRQIELKLPTL